MDLKYYKRFCKEPEKIENFEKAAADNFVGWCCHHRLQTWTSDGERRAVDITAAELIALGMYYNRPANELIFLTSSEHMSLHMKCKDRSRKGKKLSEETRKKISETLKGHPSWNKGKSLSEEHKKKLSAAKKGKPSNMKGKHLSEEAKNKISESRKGNTNVRGTRWYNNGKINVRAKKCPDGFILGMLINKHY